MIIPHNSPNKVNRLVRALNHNCDFFIHINGKTDLELFRKKLRDMDNVHLAKLELR